MNASKIWVVLLGSAAMLLLVSIAVLLTPTSEEAVASDETTTTVATPETTEVPVDGISELKEKSQRISREFLLNFWDENEVNSSLVLVDQDEERGDESFLEETAQTSEDLLEFLNSDADEAAAARNFYEECLMYNGYGADELTRLLSTPDAWGTHQILPEAEWVDNTYYVNGKAKVSSHRRAVNGGDIVHIYVTLDGNVLECTTMRGDCGNPGGKPVPPEPPTPPTTTPTSPPTTVPPTTSTTLAPKDPSKDVNVNPDVPPAVRGPGTTPVGTDPGPADPFPDPTDPDCVDDGYCGGTEPPIVDTPVPTIPPEGDPGEAIVDPEDDGPAPPPGGNAGISDPDPEPSPPPPQPPVEGDPCDDNPSLPICDG